MQAKTSPDDTHGLPNMIDRVAAIVASRMESNRETLQDQPTTNTEG